MPRRKRTPQNVGLHTRLKGLARALLDSIEEPGSGATVSERIAVANFVDKIAARDARPNEAASYDALVAVMTDQERQELRALLDRIRAIKTAATARLGPPVAAPEPSPAPEEPAPEPPARAIAAPPVHAPEPVPDPDELIEVRGSKGTCLVRRGDLSKENRV
jgi:hypothetical protein